MFVAIAPFLSVFFFVIQFLLFLKGWIVLYYYMKF